MKRLAVSSWRLAVSGARGYLLTAICYLLSAEPCSADTIESDETDMWFSVPSWMPLSSPDTLTVGSDTSEWFHGLTNTVLSVTNMQFGAWTGSTSSSYHVSLSYSVLRGNPSFTVEPAGVTDTGPQLDSSGRWKSAVRPFVILRPNGPNEQPVYSVQLSAFDTVCRHWDMPSPGVRGSYDEENANLVRLVGSDSFSLNMSSNSVRIDVVYEETWRRDLLSAVTNLAVTNSIWLARLDPELRASIVNAYSGAFDRQYFAWECQSNEWDEAVYGPRSPTNFWFSTTNGTCRGWCRDYYFDVWPHETVRDYEDTNAWQELSREHADTHYRRLFGYTNYWHFVRTHLEGWAPGHAYWLFSEPFDVDRPFWEPRYSYCEMNGYGYEPYGDLAGNSSRWATTAAMPKDAPETPWPEFSWTSSAWSHNWAGTLFKLDRLTNDFVFVDWTPPTEYADGLAGASAERAIREVAFGDFSSWGDDTNAWDRIRPYRLNSSWMDVLTNEFVSASPSAGYALGLEGGGMTRRLFLEPLALASQSISLMDRTYDEYSLHSVSATVWQCHTSMMASNSYDVVVGVIKVDYGAGIAVSVVEAGEFGECDEFERTAFPFDGYTDMELVVHTNFVPCAKRAFTVRVTPTATNDPLVEDHSESWLELPDIGTWIDGGTLIRHSPSWVEPLVDGATLRELGQEAIEGFGSPTNVDDWASLEFQIMEVPVSETRVEYWYDVTLWLSNGMYYAADVRAPDPEWNVGTNGVVSCYVWIDRSYTTTTVDLSGELYEPFDKWPYRPGWSLERGSLVEGTWSLLSLMGYGSETNAVAIDANCHPQAGDTYLYQSGSEELGSDREFWNAVRAKQGAIRDKSVADAAARIGGAWNWPQGHIPIYPANFGGHHHGPDIVQHFDVCTFRISIVHGEDTPPNTQFDWSHPTWGLPASAFRPTYWRWDAELGDYVTNRAEIVGLPFPVGVIYNPSGPVDRNLFDLHGLTDFRHRPQDEGVEEHSAYSGDGKCELINKVDWRFKHLRRGTD